MTPPPQTCEDLVPGYLCTCNDGFIVDPDNADNCLDIDECTDELDNCGQVAQGYASRDDRFRSVRTCLEASYAPVKTAISSMRT